MQLSVIKFQHSRHLTDKDFTWFLHEEQEYFNSLLQEPEEDVLAFKYLETLESQSSANSKI
ncbi:hypothetical protein DACRYDRAFT_106078 [Dacryopinax primogenitus]|uniref:Uncharacterized protein n=1 Tax=Dacryopinax primogenitus (strain DJM 731) TaxID=1858805 RepID=M5GCJ5_DACPD|nr:uncharacterized protein DACRYDRAFT_106078 [Dacryopinax primogenitus]EJU03917.1 hypothetical protein DACRYDRAFT_106078 [Dacryopinax primogenitus]